MTPHPNLRAVVLRETAISMVINAVLSILFFLAVFGRSAPVGTAALAPDFLPQAIMVALMGSLVPALLVARGNGSPKRPIVIRALGFAFAGLIVAGGGAYAVCVLVGPALLAPLPAIALKAAFGAALAAVITPFAVRAALRLTEGQFA